MILVATDVTCEAASVNLEIAKHFAREKELELLECNMSNQKQVDEIFLKLVDKIMASWQEPYEGIS